MSKYKPYIDPSRRISRTARMRNRCIALFVFVLLCVGIGSCLSGNSNEEIPLVSEKVHQASQDTKQEDNAANHDSVSAEQAQAMEAEEESDMAAVSTPTPVESLGTAAPTGKNQDKDYIQKQKDPYLAEKIDNLLKAYRPPHAMVLVVDAKTNEILAWGERKDSVNQSKPDYLIRSTFPAASLAKTITIAAAMESNRYSLNTPIPMIGRAHRLYKNQLKVPEKYKGPTLALQDAYAMSANPPLAIIGMNVGAGKLKAAARNLGYNMNFAAKLPNRSTYAPPDTGFGLAEASCGFTDATTISPLLAAAQVRSILMKKPLEIPWSSNLEGFAPKKPLALEVGKFSENTYYGLRQAMIRSVTNGTARKNISTKHMARKNYDALTIGGKTGSLDGPDPYGRYDWFMGFAQSKENPNKAIIVVVMQIYDPQGIRPQPTTQVTAMVMNYWAHQYVTNKGSGK
ncbi:MAG: penicillin-binding protein [Fibrobacter sp.]|nr:penicillin-binding protein [Fibrobacter sp.]